MTISLHEKLDNITIPDTPIPEEDIAAVNELQEDFYRELQDMEDAINALQQLGREDRTRWLQAHLKKERDPDGDMKLTWVSNLTQQSTSSETP